MATDSATVEMNDEESEKERGLKGFEDGGRPLEVIDSSLS